jgi:hypothetical protein
MSDFMKIRPVEDELCRSDGQTHRHMTKVIVAFRSFENTPKNSAFYPTCYGNTLTIRNSIELQAFMAKK